MLHLVFATMLVDLMNICPRHILPAEPDSPWDYISMAPTGDKNVTEQTPQDRDRSCFCCQPSCGTTYIRKIIAMGRFSQERSVLA